MLYAEVSSSLIPNTVSQILLCLNQLFTIYSTESTQMKLNSMRSKRTNEV